MTHKILMGLDRGVWEYSIEEICRKCQDLKLNGLEIQPEHPEIFEDFPNAGNVKKVLADYDLKLLSVHAPMKDINISSYNPKIREASLNELKQTIKFAAELSDDVLYVVAHGGQNSFRSTSQFQKSYLPKAIKYTIRAFQALIKDCDEYGITLSIENMTYSPWRLSSKILFLDQIFAEVPNLQFTFDYHHGIFGSERYTLRILKTYRNRLVSVHIGNFYEIRKIYNSIKHLDLPIVIEPHHLRQEHSMFEELKIITRQIRGLS